MNPYFTGIDNIQLIKNMAHWDKCKCDKCQKEVKMLNDELEYRHSKKNKTKFQRNDIEINTQA